MFPSVVPDYIRRDVYRESECWVYDQLKEELDDDWRVYYSRPWIGLTDQGEEKEGEADFVVAHRDHGFLTLEVKGGQVRRVEGTEVWTSKNRLGITNNVKNPFRQASTSKFEILKQFKAEPGMSHRWITARHGVILPDCQEPDLTPGLDMPRFLTAFSSDCQWLGAWVKARLTRQRADDDPPGNGLGDAGLQALHRLLAGAIEFRTSLRRILSVDGREIERLTREQFDLLSSLEEEKQLSISGGAGTGKTLLALEKALRSAEAGRRTLLVCFNAPLGDHLREVTSDQAGIVAGSFHSVCRRMAPDIPDPAAGDQGWFEHILPQAMADVVQAKPSLKFDTVIVDEGQDFTDEWFRVLKRVLRDPEDGELYVFYDDNQRVYQRDDAWRADLPTFRFHLARNLRNTKTIHAASRPWYISSRLSRPSGPDGQPVVWRSVAQHQTAESALSSVLSELTKQLDIDPKDIAVLTPRPRDNHPLVREETLCGFEVVAAGRRAKQGLVFDSIRRFKGMERKVVVLIEPEAVTDPEIAYVGLTRASLLLYVIGSQRHLDRIKTGVATG